MSKQRLGTHQWYCDTCGDVISQPEQGWVEWDSVPAGGFRIVHHKLHSPLPGERGCYAPYKSLSSHLHDFFGVDGLAKTISLIDRSSAVDAEAFAEFFRRLHVPNYESARAHQVNEDEYDTNGLYEYTQDGIAYKLSLNEENG